MSGIVGQFFTPFGITVGVTIFWSLVISLTLSPMLSSRIVTYHEKKSMFARGINSVIGGIENIYRKALRFAINFRLVIIIISVVIIFSPSIFF